MAGTPILPLPTSRPAAGAREGAGSAIVGLGFAVVLLLFLGVLVAADRGWSGQRSEPRSVAPAAAAPAPTIPVPEGWRTVRDDAAGFSLALPDGWTDVPLDAATMDLLIDEAVRADPKFLDGLDRQAREVATAGGRLLAYETERGGSLNVTVMKTDAEGATRSNLSREMAAELANLGVEGIDQEWVTIPAGPALRLSYDLVIAGTRLHQVMYMVLSGGDVFAVTLTSNDPGGDAPIIDGIGRSFATATAS